MSHIQALSAQLGEAKVAHKALAAVRLREAELKGQLRTVKVERSHEHAKRDAARDLWVLSEQLHDSLVVAPLRVI